jgi:adenine-specific DNA methylase
MNPGGNTKTLKEPWKKGQSGNPAGRPKKVVDVAALARDSSTKAMEKLAKLVDSEDERVALQAAMAVLDRAVGKPKQSVETSQKKEAADFTESELISLARLGRSGVAEADTSEEQSNRLQ